MSRLMWRHEVNDLAYDLMKKHGLSWRWSFSLVRTVEPEIAVCCSDRQIHFSVGHARIFGEDVVRPILLHEIAHALVGTEHGHDEVWRAKTKDIEGYAWPTISLPQELVSKAYLLNKRRSFTQKVVVKDDGKVVRGRRLRP